MAKVDEQLATHIRIWTTETTLNVLQAAQRAGDGLLFKGWKLNSSGVPREGDKIVEFDIATASLKEAGALRYRAGGKHGQFSVFKANESVDDQGRSLYCAALDIDEMKIVQDHIGGFIPAGPKKLVGYEAFRNYLDVLSVEMQSIDPNSSCEIISD